MDEREDRILIKQTEQNRKNQEEDNQSSEMIKELELNSKKRVVFYTAAADGKVTANVFFAKETFWMTQQTMTELFGVKTPAISKHLKNIYASGELSENDKAFRRGRFKALYMARSQPVQSI